MRAKRRRVVKGEEDAEEIETGDYDNVVRVDNHCIYFHAEVTRKTVNELIKALRVASVNATRTGHARIDLLLHSDGGDAFSGLSAMDHVERNLVPVRTIADGFVASAATFILLAGRERAALKHSWILIHQLSGEVFGKYVELVEEVKNSTAMMQQIKEIYENRTSVCGKRLDNLLKKEMQLNASRAQRLGLVQTIL
jgi:ATP-dependent protease ClpP protease subunit